MEFRTWGHFTRCLPRQSPPSSVGSAPRPGLENEKMQNLSMCGTCGLLPPASLLPGVGLLLMNGWEGGG